MGDTQAFEDLQRSLARLMWPIIDERVEDRDLALHAIERAIDKASLSLDKLTKNDAQDFLRETAESIARAVNAETECQAVGRVNFARRVDWNLPVDLRGRLPWEGEVEARKNRVRQILAGGIEGVSPLQVSRVLARLNGKSNSEIAKLEGKEVSRAAVHAAILRASESLRKIVLREQRVAEQVGELLDIDVPTLKRRWRDAKVGAFSKGATHPGRYTALIGIHERVRDLRQHLEGFRDSLLEVEHLRAEPALHERSQVVEFLPLIFASVKSPQYASPRGFYQFYPFRTRLEANRLQERTIKSIDLSLRLLGKEGEKSVRAKSHIWDMLREQCVRMISKPEIYPPAFRSVLLFILKDKEMRNYSLAYEFVKHLKESYP